MVDVKKLLSKLLAYQKDQMRVMDLGTTWISSTGATSFSQSYSCPSGYKPLWAWVYSDGDVRSMYVSVISTSSVTGWALAGGACNAHIVLLFVKE